MIDFINVEKTYKSGVDALKGVSFTIEDGEFVFIIGKSGSGKSTLLKCITCEEKPTKGKVTIDNFDISHMPRALVPVLRRKIGMIYQDFRLIDSKTVAENVAFAGEIIGVPKKSLDNTVQFCLSLVGLRHKANSYPQELSGGEQQRVAIARALVNNPSLIVADEPTGNLDPETSEAIMAMLLEINKTGASGNKTTVIICTHDQTMVDRIKKRVIEIEGGLIVRDESESGYHESADSETKNLASTTSRTSLYSGTVEDAVSFGDDQAYSDNYDDPDFQPDQTKVSAPIMFNDDLTKHEKLFSATPAAPQLPPETMPEELKVEEIVPEKEEEAMPAPSFGLEPEAPEAPAAPVAEPEIIEINVSPETLTAANESDKITFGEDANKTEGVPAPITGPATDVSFDAPEKKPAKDEKPAKEAKPAKEPKAKKKSDKPKKPKKGSANSGNDIDMFPED